MFCSKMDGRARTYGRRMCIRRGLGLGGWFGVVVRVMWCVEEECATNILERFGEGTLWVNVGGIWTSVEWSIGGGVCFV